MGGEALGPSLSFSSPQTGVSILSGNSPYPLCKISLTELWGNYGVFPPTSRRRRWSWKGTQEGLFRLERSFSTSRLSTLQISSVRGIFFSFFLRRIFSPSTSIRGWRRRNEQLWGVKVEGDGAQTGEAERLLDLGAMSKIFDGVAGADWDPALSMSISILLRSVRFSFFVAFYSSSTFLSSSSKGRTKIGEFPSTLYPSPRKVFVPLLLQLLLLLFFAWAANVAPVVAALLFPVAALLVAAASPAKLQGTHSLLCTTCTFLSELHFF